MRPSGDRPRREGLLGRWARADDREAVMEEVFGDEGLLAEAMPGYESRREQLEMAAAVARSCTNGKKMIVEAGTGTGKSLAYLVPMILYATETGNKVVISTGTKTLQHQILEKDLPLIQETLGLKFNAALCLGAENYMCIRRFRAWKSDNTSFKGGKIARNRIIQWAKRTKTGIKAEMDFHPEAWRAICRSSDLCPLNLCNKEPDCPYNKARKQWNKAHLLIVNHYLFFANIISGGSVLPEYGAVVFDEAHQVEDVATNYLGMEVSNTGLDRFLNTIYGGKSGKGLYQQLNYIDASVREEMKQYTEEMRRRGHALFDAIADKFPGQSVRARMREPAQGKPVTLETAKDLQKVLKRARKESTMEEDQASADAALTGARELELKLEYILQHQDPEAVYWFEVDRSAGGRLKSDQSLVETVDIKSKKARVSMNMAPLSVAGALRRMVYQKTGAVIFVSATLSVAGSLDYASERLGLLDSEQVMLPHSFDYENRVMFWTDRESPDPSKTRDHQEHVLRRLTELLPSMSGGTFVLFTSYRLLDNVFYELKRKWETSPPPGSGDILLLRHGQAPREELLDRFRDHGRAALFGTTTFWQGIDVPGRALECVLITKLPFAVPDEPIVEARVESMREEGRNPFYEYQVPQAIMMFRQGFGRLMRKRDDRGAVIALDPRLHTKRYGQLFLESIPECRIGGSLDEVIAFLEEE